MPTHKKAFSDTDADQNELEQDIFVEGDPALTGLNDSKDNAGFKFKTEKVSYLKEMILELKNLSDEIEEPMTSYLLEMAYIEIDTAQTVRDFSDDLEPSDPVTK